MTISRDLAETIREEVILYLRHRLKTGQCDTCGQTDITGTELNTLLTELERHGIAAINEETKKPTSTKPVAPAAFAPPKRPEKIA